MSALSLARIIDLGYGEVVLLVGVQLAVLGLLHRSSRNRVDAVVWRCGSWEISLGGRPVAIELLGVGQRLPQLLYLRWRALHENANGHLWLFPDSADSRSLRALRRYLIVQR